MTTMLAPEESTAENDVDQSYKVVSKAAVVALLLGLASFLALMLPAFTVLPLFGLISGLVALRAIRQYPDELTGKMPAIIGAALSALLLIGSSTLHATIYMTEVPDGFERRSFDELQPDRQRPDLPIPPAAMEMRGKKVFIKGYVHPGVQGMGPVDKFVLVPDMGTCCFGGQPKLTDMIEVQLVQGSKISYSMRKRALAGTFEVDPNIVAPDGSQGACYKLIAEYVK